MHGAPTTDNTSREPGRSSSHPSWREKRAARISERKNLEKRADDSEEVAVKRYDTYEKNSKPVLDFYEQSGLLKVVNGEGSISKISSEISALIEAI